MGEQLQTDFHMTDKMTPLVAEIGEPAGRMIVLQAGAISPLPSAKAGTGCLFMPRLCIRMISKLSCRVD